MHPPLSKFFVQFDQNGQKGQGIVPAGHGEAHDGEAHDGEADDANLRNCELESTSTMTLSELCMCCKKKIKLLAAGVKNVSIVIGCWCEKRYFIPASMLVAECHYHIYV